MMGATRRRFARPERLRGWELRRLRPPPALPLAVGHDAGSSRTAGAHLLH